MNTSEARLPGADPDGDATGDTSPTALCLGEGLAVLSPQLPGVVASRRLDCSVGGAECNVAGGLVELGVPTTWVSRLGGDPFGDLVEDDLVGRGVRVLAERDADRPTGAYVKVAGTTGSRMHYYRAGSAATTMTGRTLDAPEVAEVLAGCGLVHTSGITAGVLDDSSDLLTELLVARDRHGFRLSVDLNWRPALWRGRPLDRLVDLLRHADVVLLGEDEAGAALGADRPEFLRVLLGERPTIVLKGDSRVAHEIAPDGSSVDVPALRVDVVEPVGAGDGFAAGYLAGLLHGEGAEQRLRLGHLVAAGVLAQPGDHAPPPSAGVRRALLEATPEAWAATKVDRAGVTSPALETGGVR